MDDPEEDEVPEFEGNRDKEGNYDGQGILR
jgi:hypothetical protein